MQSHQSFQENKQKRVLNSRIGHSRTRCLKKTKSGFEFEDWTQSHQISQESKNRVLNSRIGHRSTLYYIISYSILYYMIYNIICPFIVILMSDKCYLCFVKCNSVFVKLHISQFYLIKCSSNLLTCHKLIFIFVEFWLRLCNGFILFSQVITKKKINNI